MIEASSDFTHNVAFVLRKH